jgi:hypothetical protein
MIFVGVKQRIGIVKKAFEKKYFPVIGLLLNETGFNPTIGGNTIFLTLVKNKHIRIIRMMLKDERIDPTVPNNDALRNDIINEDNDMIQLHIQDSRIHSAAMEDT